MQAELDDEYPELGIRILGCNEFGEESGNESMTDGRDIPWLQDIDADNDGNSDVWTSWNVELRDFVIVNVDNVRVGSVNLTTMSLAIPENYELVKQMLIDASTRLGDVNRDGVVNFLDINPFVELLDTGEYQVEADVNKDGVVDSMDVAPFVDLFSFCN